MEGEGGRACVKGDNVRKEVSHKHARKQKKCQGNSITRKNPSEEGTIPKRRILAQVDQSDEEAPRQVSLPWVGGKGTKQKND